jgi:hypothetical protein
MDQSKALQRLTESADLVGMIEELIRASQSERLSPATASGMRITLRNIRESILASHDVFANDLMSRTRGRSELPTSAAPQSGDNAAASAGLQGGSPDLSYGSSSGGMATGLSDPSRLGIRRQNLRASLEKIAE